MLLDLKTLLRTENFIKVFQICLTEKQQELISDSKIRIKDSKQGELSGSTKLSLHPLCKEKQGFTDLKFLKYKASERLLLIH